MLNKYIVLENIRSAYNVGNIVRTADALGRGVLVCGYTPSPISHPKVIKTSLGAEKSIFIKEFSDSSSCLSWLKENLVFCVGAEITNDSKKLDYNLISENYKKKPHTGIAVILGNEVDGVMQETIGKLDIICNIPMNGDKESLNVGQAGAIFMRELNKVS